MPKYCVENAKSGRSSCKRCKVNIEKDALRVGTVGMMNDHETVSWNHLTCFKLPKNTQLDNFLVELQGFQDLDGQKQLQIRSGLESQVHIVGNKRTVDSSNASSSSPPSAKKATVIVGNQGPNDPVYQKYHKMTIDQLKDFLRWNNQVLKGTKPELVAKCVDGEKNGALPSCPEIGCGGRLNADYDLNLVTCNGKFDEDRGFFVKCFFKVKASGVSGRLPWRTSPPTDEEKANEEAAAAGNAISTAGVANLFDGLDLRSSEGRKGAVQLLVARARSLGIKLPEQDSQANIRVGGILISDSTATPAEILQVLAREFGTETSNEAKRTATTMGTVCPANERIVMALSEKAQQFIAINNAQASLIYKKAAAAIRGLEYPVTSGKALVRAKTKVAGVGAKVAKLIDLFLLTGSMNEATTSSQDNDDDNNDNDNEDIHDSDNEVDKGRTPVRSSQTSRQSPSQSQSQSQSSPKKKRVIVALDEDDDDVQIL